MSWISTRLPDQRQRRLFAGCLLIFVATAVVAALTSRAEDWQPISLVLALAAFNFASELLAVRRDEPPHAPWASASSAPVVLMIVLLGPAPAFVFSTLAVVVSAFHDRAPISHIASNLANYGSFSVTGGLLANWAINAFDLAPDDLGFALLIVGISIHVVGWSFLFNAATGRIEYGDTIRGQYYRERGRTMGAEAPATLLTAATGYAYGIAGVLALGLLAVLQLSFQYVARNLLLSEERAEALQKRANELAELHATLEEQAERLSKLSASRGRLVGQVLQAEENERRRLAEDLHDEALQDLCFARQALPPPSDGKEQRAGAALERAIGRLRSAIFDLHPAVLEHAGLAAALNEVADIQAERAGFRAAVEVDPAACGTHDPLLFVLGREQLTNAAKHSGATSVELEIARSNGRIVMEVSDNGCGMDAACPRMAVEQGHIGLASSAERIEAIGGIFEIDSAPGRGTRIRTTLPLTVQG